MTNLFDCFDFCQWSLGKHYNFRNYIAPEGSIYMPDIEELIESTQF